MFKALFDNVLIKRDEAEEKTTPGGIFIPQKNADIPYTAKVISVGENVVVVSAGDTVYISEFSGSKIMIDGEEYFVVKSEDILGVEVGDK